jgi:di/tripeptidase
MDVEPAECLEEITQQLPKWREGARQIRELLLANAVMIGELPAPTGAEADRVAFLHNRFIESDCANVSTDEAGNALALIPGTKSEKTIFVAAHLDTPFASNTDHTITVTPDSFIGPGILDNSIGLAVIATLPSLIERLGLSFNDDILLMGTSRSLGEGDMAGMRFFLNHNQLPLRTGLLLEGGTLGRLSYAALALLRVEVTCELPRHYNFGDFGASGAIPILTKLVQRLRGIPLPRDPKSTMVFGSLEAGNAFNSAARHGCLKFELRSEEEGRVGKIYDEVQEIIDEMRHEAGVKLTLRVVSKRSIGGISYAHPLVRTTRSLMKTLEIEPIIAPSTGELAAVLSRGIPGLTLGLTQGAKRHELDESAQIEPIFTGLAQLIGVLKAIDQGICDAKA